MILAYRMSGEFSIDVREKGRNSRMAAASKVPATQDFQFIGGSIALDLVNTVGNRLGEKRDYFRSAEDVERWAMRAGLIGESESLQLSPKQLKRIRTMREELYGIFRPVVRRAGSRPTREGIARLNAMLGSISLTRKLRWSRGRVEWESGVLAHDAMSVLTPILLNAAEILVTGEFQKVRQCADENCGWLFLDASQAGRRRWCSMRDCGNRAKARRHYGKVAKHF
jgi:predicted RNA-binding Zn ribbon-like protein